MQSQHGAELRKSATSTKNIFFRSFQVLKNDFTSQEVAFQNLQVSSFRLVPNLWGFDSKPGTNGFHYNIEIIIIIIINMYCFIVLQAAVLGAMAVLAITHSLVALLRIITIFLISLFPYVRRTSSLALPFWDTL
jgi:hypothetical protein